MRFLTYVIFFISFVAYSQDSAYEKEIEAFRKTRIDSLKHENGWLNLAGLFWLKEGENTIGSDSKNDFVFPVEHSDSFLGKVILEKGIVTFKSKEANQVFSSGHPVKEIIAFDDKKALIFAHKSLRWFIIKRGNQYALRLRDLAGEYVRNFKGINYFPINASWRINAKFVPVHGKKLHVTDMTGRTYLEDSPGDLYFTIKGRKYRLEAGGTRDEFFIVFGDLTNKKTTYGGGRFLYANSPDKHGNVILDFNKSLNPPCVFTPFATCPLPTKKNKLSLEVEAGEQSIGFLNDK
jgi:uncharacterized protein (DUF1684 family)